MKSLKRAEHTYELIRRRGEGGGETRWRKAKEGRVGGKGGKYAGKR